LALLACSVSAQILSAQDTCAMDATLRMSAEGKRQAFSVTKTEVSGIISNYSEIVPGTSIETHITTETVIVHSKPRAGQKFRVQSEGEIELAHQNLRIDLAKLNKVASDSTSHTVEETVKVFHTKPVEHVETSTHVKEEIIKVPETTVHTNTHTHTHTHTNTHTNTHTSTQTVVEKKGGEVVVTVKPNVVKSDKVQIIETKSGETIKTQGSGVVITHTNGTKDIVKPSGPSGTSTTTTTTTVKTGGATVKIGGGQTTTTTTTKIGGGKKPVCQAYAVNAHKNYCVRRNGKKCVQWKAIYRQNKCVKWANVVKTYTQAGRWIINKKSFHATINAKRTIYIKHRSNYVACIKKRKTDKKVKCAQLKKAYLRYRIEFYNYRNNQYKRLNLYKVKVGAFKNQKSVFFYRKKLVKCLRRNKAKKSKRVIRIRVKSGKRGKRSLRIRRRRGGKRSLRIRRRKEIPQNQKKKRWKEIPQNQKKKRWKEIPQNQKKKRWKEGQKSVPST
jgi:hypothetical protein